MRNLARGLAVVALASAAIFGSGLPAFAAPVSCGDDVVVSTTLTADLHCAGTGLRVAPNVTLDLGGHTITGSGAGVGLLLIDLPPTDEDIPPVRSDVRVRNGRVTRFDRGLDSDYRFQSIFGSLAFDRVRIDHTFASITGPQATDLTILRSEIADNAYGPTAGFGSRAVTVRNSSISRNSLGGVGGFNVGFVFDASVIDSNGSSVECVQGGATFRDTRITRNAGIMDLFQCGAFFDRVVYEGNSGGVRVSQNWGGGVDIRNSRFANNAGVALDVREGAGSQIVDNVFVGNGAGLLWDCYPVCSITLANTISRNRFTRNAADGLSILNLAGDQNDGTYVISDNVALRNGGWGVYVEPVANLTASGNTASGNGMPPQCSGIPCN